MLGLKRKKVRSINIDLRDAVRDVLNSEGRTVSCDWYTVNGTSSGCMVSFSDADQQLVMYQFTQLATALPDYTLEICVTARVRSLRVSEMQPYDVRPHLADYTDAFVSFSTPVEFREWLRGEGQGAHSVSLSLSVTRR